MQKLLIDNSKRILVVSPHPDDESIGCGALLEKYGKQCDVLLLTDGRYGNPEWSEGRTKRVRWREFTEAMRFAGVRHYDFLQIPDLSLNKFFDCLQELDFSSYDYVFTPGAEDQHPDHKAAYKFVMSKIWGIPSIVLFEYEIWTPFTDFTHYLVHDGVFKSELIKNYKCQLVHVDYLQMTYGLGLYRGASIAKDKGMLAEVYRANYIEGKSRFSLRNLFDTYRKR